MKKIIGLLITLIIMFSFSACSAKDTGTSETANENDNHSSEAVSAETNNSNESSDQTETGKKNLVVCFSATGNTKAVSEKIVEVTGADYFEIIPTEPYSESDLNYSDDGCRANREQQDETARPSISGNIEKIEQYEVVLIGYPIWWGMEPRIMDTFMESYDFSGKTLANFCTSGGSGINTSTENLKALSTEANWLDGKRFSGRADTDEIQTWIDSLGLQ